jgi:ABC-type glutathione transport system ATPase component
MLLQVRDLTVRYQPSVPPALENFTFDIAPLESVALLGESGSGKTTAALALLGLLPKTARVTGCIRFAGQEILSLPDRQLQKLRGAHISLVFQEPELALNPVLSVGRQVCEVIRAHTGLGRRQRMALARSLFEQVALSEDLYFAYPHQLSGGQRQRVAIAQAIACGPRLLIADEPTSALDSITQAQIVGLIQRLKRQRALALLVITHDPLLAGQLADRAIVLRDGRAVEQGPVSALFNLHFSVCKQRFS